MEAKFNELYKYLDTRFSSLKEELKHDISLVKDDVNHVRNDVAQVKDNVAQVKDNIAQVKHDVAHVGYEVGQVGRKLEILTEHVDRKNDDQDDIFDDHELRISTLESDYRILTHNLLA